MKFTDDSNAVRASASVDKGLLWIVPPLFLGLLALPLTALSQLTQGANTLRFMGSDNPSGTLFRTVDAFFGPNETRLINETRDGTSLTDSGLTLDDDGVLLSFIDFPSSLEGFISLMPSTWIDSSATAVPIAVGGIHDSSAMTLTTSFRGYTITQFGSTWYGNLSMNGGTTFSADTLTANTITTTSLTASSLTAGTLSVTGNTTMGGTLNMSNNRITNVADGINPTDAVNVRQLEKSQTEYRAGISSVAAIAGIPSLSNGDDGVLGVGVGTFKGESAIAIGASKRLSDNTTFKFGVGTSSSSGDVTGSFGIGIKW